MISRATITAASSTLDEVTILSIISIVRMTDRYKQIPAYFSDIEDRLNNADGTSQAKQINAALNELELLGIGEVEINQAQTVGTDGLVYSQTKERQALVDYILNVVYEELGSYVYIDTTEGLSLRGNYAVGKLPLDYSEGFL